MVEDTYEVFDTNVRIIIAQYLMFALTFPVFHPPFCLLNAHWHHPHSFVDSDTCIIGPHISLSITMPRTVYYLMYIVLKTQTLLSASP